MTDNNNAIGVSLSAETHQWLKSAGPVTPTAALILGCLAEQMPQASSDLLARLGWSDEQTIRMNELLGDDPFPLTGDSLHEAANQDQADILASASTFELIALEFRLLRTIRGRLDVPARAGKSKRVGLTLRVPEQVRFWWEQQFVQLKNGVGMILKSIRDWVMLASEEETFRKLDRHQAFLRYALSGVTVDDHESLSWVVRNRLKTYVSGDIKSNIDELKNLVDEPWSAFVDLSLVLKFAGKQPKSIVSPRISASAIEQLTALMGNRTTGVSFSAEIFPQLFYATMGNEILPLFATEELETLSRTARRHKIGPPKAEHPGLTLHQLIEVVA